MPNKIIIHKTGSRFLRNLACGSECNYLIGNGLLSKEGKVYVCGNERENINIGLMGRFDNIQREPTGEQWGSLVKLVRDKCKEYEIPLHQIFGHSELDKNLKRDYKCPGLSVDIGKLFLDVRLNIEVKDKDVVKNNLRLMKRQGKGTLCYLINNEAAVYPIGKDLCSTEVAFSYDAESGEIFRFGYYQSIPDSLKAASHEGRFIINTDMKRGITKIEKIVFSHWLAHSIRNEKSKKNLEDSVRIFNEE